MRIRRRLVLLTTLAALLTYGSVLAGVGPQDDAISLIPIAGSEEEFTALDAMEVEQNPITQLTRAATFLETYPESELMHLVHRVRIEAYLDIGNAQAAILATQEALESETRFVESRRAAIQDAVDVPGVDEFEIDFLNSKTFYYRSMMEAHNTLNNSDRIIEFGELALATDSEAWEIYARTTGADVPEYQETLDLHSSTALYLTQTVMNTYQNLNDVEKTIEYAERALELNPQDLATLITISGVMAERLPEDEDAREEHLDRAEEHAKGAIEILEQFLDGPAGAQIGAEQRDGLLSSVHSTLGLIYLRQEEFDDAQDEYETAIEAVANDPVAHFRLGTAYAQDNEVDDALEALARSAFLGGITESEARDLLERIYEAEHESLDGLDQFIAAEGTRIGNQ